MTTSDNPYRSPVADQQDPLPTKGLSSGGGLITWTVMFGVNLIVPGLLCSRVVDGQGIPGVLIAVGLMYVGSLLALWRWEFLRRPACLGGLFIALTQICPFIQIIVGYFAAAVATSLLQPALGPQPGGLSFFPAAVATFGTGGTLFVLALGVGGFLQLLFPERST